MKFRPLDDRVLVKRLEEAEKTAGGLFIPPTAQEKPNEGIVVAVGSGKRMKNGTTVPMQLSVGDHILFGKYSGSELDIDGDKHVIMDEDDVLGIVEE